MGFAMKCDKVRGRMIPSAGYRRQMRMAVRLVSALAILAICAATAAAEQTGSASLPLSKADSANAQTLARQIAALSPSVDPNEATLLADTAYATVNRLRQQYHMFGTPIFNNFLVYHGWRKRGYCYQWTEDLLVALDALKLKTLDLHWGEAYAGTWRENNCLVVTAKGQPFERGMILEAWRHFGHLRWNLVPSDEDRYFENTKWAARVRERAASKSAASNRHVALQTKVTQSDKAGDQ